MSVQRRLPCTWRKTPAGPAPSWSGISPAGLSPAGLSPAGVVVGAVAGLPLLVISSVLGAAVLGGLVIRRRPIPRYLAAGAFIAMLWGWAVAQYPALLPGSLGLRAGAAPTTSLVSEFVIVGVLVLLIVPSFVLLYRLAQRGLLSETESGDDVLADLQSGASQGPGTGAEGPTGA